MAALKAATRRYRRTEAAHETARTEAIYAVVEALRAGHRPTDVTAESPFEAAYVRRLARKNGIKPGKKPDAPTTQPDNGDTEWPSSGTGTTARMPSSPTS
jgi:hypothetical protein